MGFHTFSDFTPAQKNAYLDSYEECLAEFNAGNYSPDVDAAPLRDRLEGRGLLRRSS